MFVPVGLAVREESNANPAMAPAGMMGSGNAGVVADAVKLGARGATELATSAADRLRSGIEDLLAGQRL